MKEYDHSKIEQEWQRRWAKDRLYKTPDSLKRKENEYILVEFAYPSGNLHAGHWYAYSVPDIYARYRRMRGRNVLFPFGFDAFGLPAENAAIKNKVNPKEWTFSNIERMREQLTTTGISFDWSREVITASPDYYKWTQWLFLQLYKKGLAYQAETPVNWCPSCKTVLANEQVIAGRCERCNTEVEQRNMKQWQLRITKYADRLIDDLEKLNWPESIKTAQKNWIGRSEGVLIKFPIFNSQFSIEVFTTRPDTIFGATYMVLSPEHEVILNLKSKILNLEEVQEYIKKSKGKTELERQENKEKTGVEIKGIKAVNPATKVEIPIWIADYVLAHYSTGAIMAVPAHDERDFEFTKKYNLPMVPVVVPDNPTIFGLVAPHGLPKPGSENYEHEVSLVSTRLIEKSSLLEGFLINSGQFNGRNSREVGADIIAFVKGSKETTYKLRDWVISRQRYWGCPIPIIHCQECGVVPVPEKDLPVILPDVKDYLPDSSGKSPLAKVKNWVNVKCPECKGDAQRETDTLDTFIDSSWYFLRYTDPKNKKEFASKAKLKKWLPVNFYSGGAEHTNMHLLYSRFFHKALFDMGFVNENEPYLRRMNRGLILGPDGQKMSKSRGNVVDPDDYVKRLGADTVRTYLAFIGPYNEVGSYPWSPDSIIGVRRFFEKVWRVGQKIVNRKRKIDENVKFEKQLQKGIRDITEIIEKFKMNTAVPVLMTLVNTAEKEEISKKQFEEFLKLLAPFAPHISEEIWHDLENKKSIHLESWPAFDPKKITEESATIAVQINGKVRATLIIPFDSEENEVLESALKLPEIKKWTLDKVIKKTIYVKNRLINIVI